MNDIKPIKIHGVEVTRVQDKSTRFTGLFWGPSGSGKTTLAATLPGRKLLVNFDPDGPNSIANREDVDVLDFSVLGYNISDSFKSEHDPLGLKSIITNYDSIIVDSITNAVDRALDAGINSALVKGAHIEKPALASYQLRNRLSLKLIKYTLSFTGKFNKHCVFVGHEASPVTNEDGAVLYISLMLGGDLPNSSPIDFSEVWAVYEGPDKKRKIAIRPCRQRKPMKTRMFQTNSEPEFNWNFDPETLVGDTIEGWYNKWLENGKKKLPLPK